MFKTLYDYDIYPKVFPVGKAVDITVKALGEHVRFEGEYKITVHRINSGNVYDPATAWNHTDYTVTAGADNTLRFTYTAGEETEHYVRIWKEDKRVVQLAVYALNPDLACRIPLHGDFHMHTCRSDGREDPGIVCANYRKYGYDFMPITDHHRYYPSLEAIADYAPADPFLTILPGEEVHLPLTDVHIVNVGGTFSVNGLLESSWNFKDKGSDLKYRSLDGKAPDMVPMDEYKRQVEEIMNSEDCADCPENVDKRSYAVCLWAFRKIREGGGLGIFAHPYWISDLWQIPEPYTLYMLKKHPFDAFEVLGGESYYEENGLQTSLYYEEYRRNNVFPVVGSTDSHGSTEHNPIAHTSSTYVFARKNEREDIVSAVKDGYSVAIDTISKEYRLVGEYRYQKYVAFLRDNWMPIHDRVAAMDGEIMREYYEGEADASEVAFMRRKSEALFQKYFVTE